MRRLALVVVATACLAVPVAAEAGGSASRPWLPATDSSSAASAPFSERSAFSASREDPPSEAAGLPAAQENIELVGELNPQFPGATGGVRLGEIADLTVLKGYAYLNSWDSAVDCNRGGVYVVDMRDPAAPKQVAYVPPIQPYYHGEGAHAISVDTPAFKGDLLAVNNETWGSNTPSTNPCQPADKTGGGFDLYDVSDPANPKVLIQGAGDRVPASANGRGRSYHSTFLWQAGPRAYLVASDNVELTDVDIWDVTNPTAPTQVADVDLAARFPQILAGEQTNATAVFNHDMIVKQINGRQIMSVSNWDSGYVQIDVTDPANPTYVTDTTFGVDAFRGPLSSEGNAHQSEYSFDNQFLLAADEDFTTRRNEATILTGAGAGIVPVGGSDGAQPSQVLPDELANGTPVYVGTACDGDPIPAPPAVTGTTDAIAAIQRGPSAAAPAACLGGFSEKLRNAANAGWDAAVIFNQTRPDDTNLNMSTLGATIPAVQMTRLVAVGNATTNGRLFPGLAGATPAKGTVAQGFQFADFFDGWGYTRLYDARTSALIDSYAVPEANDPRFERGFGDLSVHEFATDPTEPIAYSAYYGAGMRTFRFSRADGLVPTGKWIDDDGNGSNFWGVEVFNSGGERYFAGSDRDFGLQIFRFTGATRAQRPVCQDVATSTAFETAVQVPLTCTDANTGNVLTRRAQGAANGTLGAVAGNQVTYTPRAGFAGTDTFTFAANDGAVDSAPATATVTVRPRQEAVYYYGIKVKPRITARAKPKTDKRKPFKFTVKGQLQKLGRVPRSEGCRGGVQVVAKRGARTISKRKVVRLKQDCRYSVAVKLSKKAGKRGKVRFAVRFAGNERLFAAKATARAKYGKAKRKRK